MAVELEQSPAHSPSPASSPGRNDPFTRIEARCKTLEEIGRQGQAGLRGLLGVNEINEQTAQDLADGLGFLRNVEIDIEGFESGIEFLPGLESCDHTKVMERVFGLTRNRPIVPKIRGGIVERPPGVVDYTKVLADVLAARDLREDHVLLDHIRESLTISQRVIKTISEGGTFPNVERFYAAKFIRDKSRGYLTIADEAYQEALRKYHTKKSHSDI